MDEILTTLSWVIDKMENMSVTVELKGSDGKATELLETLVEGSMYLRRARASLRRAEALLQKGHGKLVEPEERGGSR